MEGAAEVAPAAAAALPAGGVAEIGTQLATESAAVATARPAAPRRKLRRLRSCAIFLVQAATHIG